MTVSTTTFYTDWLVADGTRKVWDYDFYIPRESTVIIQTTTDLAGDITDHTSNFSLSGGYAGGTITYPSSGDPLPAGTFVRIVREMPLTQEVEIGNEGSFNPELHMKVFDDIVMALQQVANATARSLKVPLGREDEVATLSAALLNVNSAIDDILAVYAIRADVSYIATNAEAYEALYADRAKLVALADDLVKLIVLYDIRVKLAYLADNATVYETLYAERTKLISVANNLTALINLDASMGTLVSLEAALDDLLELHSNTTALLLVPSQAAAEKEAAQMAASDAATAANSIPQFIVSEEEPSGGNDGDIWFQIE